MALSSLLNSRMSMERYALPGNCSLIPNSDNVQLIWKRIPEKILVVHKFCDDNVIESVKSLVNYLLQKWDVTVLLEIRTIAELRKDDRFLRVLDRYLLSAPPSFEQSIQSTPAVECVCRTPLNPSESVPCPVNYNNQEINEKSSIRPFENAHSPEVDLVVCLGGDGTLLNISSMFQRVVPPVIAFRLGSLGFLTPFPFRAFPSHMESTMTGICNYI
ncbi:hypothetical protein FGIG_04961 [Fasciola gigantica]|uniref:NAD(+) kinase n=1 Tax=Fasciola gigantica TaxID=46835 RepID=A0A504YEN6_FASGI|nr:hypothetical protein FGIG_04961 [Fasciola gigantica]